MDTHPTELALYAGAGGGLLASKWLLGHRIVAYVEINPYRQKVLQARIADGLLDDAPIWDNVTDFDGRPWSGRADIVSGGFPCTPWSIAGSRRGTDDPRNLWPDTLRITREVGPSIAFLENVPPLIRQPYFRDAILGGLAESGYDAVWGVFSAAQVGAPHLRQRLFILAYARGEQRRIQSIGLSGISNTTFAQDDGADRDVADAEGEQERRLPIGEIEAESEFGVSSSDRGEWGPAKSRLHRVFDGLASGLDQNSPWESEWADTPRVLRGCPDRRHRLEALGDGQVPLCMAYAYATLFERAFGVSPRLAL